MSTKQDAYITPFSLSASKIMLKAGSEQGKAGIAELEGILSTQSEDTEGDTIFISGMDITPLNSGNAQINWWHLGKKNPAMVIGLIDWAKKIDNNTRVAFKGHLLNTESGRAAKELMEALEAEGKQIGVSVEGSTIVKNGSKVYKSIAYGCALATDQINKECTAALIKAVRDYTIDESLTPEDAMFQKAIGIAGDAPFNTNPAITTNLGLRTFDEALEELKKDYPDINPDLIKELLLKILKDDER